MDKYRKRIKNFMEGKTHDSGCHLDELEEKIGYHFHSRDNLLEALTHSSILGELSSRNDATTYERLEFLGDAVLGLVTTELLMRQYPRENEGQLTKKKSLLVSTGLLSKKAERLGLNDHIILSKNAFMGGVQDRESIQTAVLEAIIGALYLDGGMEPAKSFIEGFILDRVEEDIQHRDHINYKSEMQELTQKIYGVYPSYRVRSTRGPEHDKMFWVEVEIDGRVVGLGRGSSKKDAEQMAAKEGLARLEKEGENSDE
ncbi:MAG: ribonuclease III [Candidatus Latescibacteria bacterium]|nr:ribonuclease III [bacterium]MBD3424093.1 ribonuclease III [Candidatus Latescibacterota bacterium]